VSISRVVIGLTMGWCSIRMFDNIMFK